MKEPIDPGRVLKSLGNTPTQPPTAQPPKPRIIKHEARTSDLRLTYSIAENNLATNPQLMELLVEKLSAVLFFCSVSESIAAHVLSDFQAMIDEFRRIFAGTKEEPEDDEHTDLP